VVQIPRYVYVNLKSPVFIAYEGVTGINYEDAYNVRDKSFWGGYVLSIIHEGKPRPVITDIYEELYRRLVLSVFGGENVEQTIMENSKKLIEMIAASQGMVRTSPQDEVLGIALIDPTFWMQGAFDRFEDVGTFFGRQAFLEYRVTKQLDATLDDIKKFIQGYNVHLREVNAIPLEELYPKGYPLDFFLAIWAMMDILDKTTTQNIPLNHADILLLKELAYSLLTEHPLSKEINNFI
ncbi:MAG: hypothetical protein ACTSQF_13895, partial [Candidatus Heimdallarchaeaceae archaeon]